MCGGIEALTIISEAETPIIFCIAGIILISVLISKN